MFNVLYLVIHPSLHLSSWTHVILNTNVYLEIIPAGLLGKEKQNYPLLLDAW